MPEQGLTLDQLQAAGAQPAEGLTLEELQHAGAKPAGGAPRTLSAAKAVASGKVVGTENPILDLLRRTGSASMAALARGPGAGLQTLLHSDPQSQYDADTDVVNRMGTFGDVPESPARRVVDRFLTQMAVDPMNLAGGAGILDRLAGKAAVHALPAALAVGGKVGSLVSRYAPDAVAAAAPKVGDVLKGAYDYFTFGGPTKRALAAAKSPEDAATAFAHLRAAKGVGQEALDAVTTPLMREWSEIRDSVSKQDLRKVLAAINGGTTAQLPKALRATAQRFSDLTDSVAHLMGTNDLRAKLAQYGFKPAQWVNDLQTAIGDAGRGIQKAAQYRRNYVPLGHEEMMSLDALERSLPFSKNLRTALSTKDPFLRSRGEGLVAPDVNDAIRNIETRLRSAAQMIGGQAARAHAADALTSGARGLLPREFTDFLTKDRLGELEQYQGFAKPGFDALKAIVNLPKQALFALPFRHMENIGFLQALHHPEALVPGGVDFAKLMAGGDRGKILGQAAEQGLTGRGNSDRANAAADFLGKVPLALRALGGGAAGGYEGYKQGGLPGAVGGALAGAGLGAASPNIFRASNKILWTFDDAMKSSAMKAAAAPYIARGMKAADAYARAAKDVGDRLVNYAERSQFTRDMAYFMPFATWATKTPGSIIRAIIEHPERQSALQRLIPGAMGRQTATDQTNHGRPVGASMTTPFSENVLRFSDPWHGARSVLSFPYQALGSAARLNSDRKTGGYPNYFTYGKPPLQWLLHGAVDLPGTSPFGGSFLDDLLSGQTGLTEAAIR